MTNQQKLDNKLIKLSQKGDLTKIKLLVSQGADIHADNSASLRWSASNGRLDVVKYLVQLEVDINKENCIALINSASHGYLKTVKYLIQLGANIHSYDDDALKQSAKNGQLDVVKYLVENGAKINCSNRNHLEESARHGKFEVVKYLVENGADNFYINKSLIVSSKCKHLNIVSYLIIDCNMTVQEETLTWLQEKELSDTINIINSRDLHNKLNNSSHTKIKTNQNKVKI